jgi:hypothetical protein
VCQRRALIKSLKKTLVILKEYSYNEGIKYSTEKEVAMRIQLDLPEEKVHELKALMEEADIETYKELFNNALTLLEWSIEESKAGRALASVDTAKDQYHMLVMPILQRVAKKYHYQPSTATVERVQN